jgi:Glutaredoxin
VIAGIVALALSRLLFPSHIPVSIDEFTALSVPAALTENREIPRDFADLVRRNPERWSPPESRSRRYRYIFFLKKEAKSRYAPRIRRRSINVSNGKITMYGTAWCQDCKRAKQFFGEHRIAYAFIDVDEDADGLQTLSSTTMESTLFRPSCLAMAACWWNRRTWRWRRN